MENHNLVHVIEDDVLLAGAIEMLLTAEGFVVKSYASAAEFLSVGMTILKGCILTDLRMPGGRIGFDILGTIVNRDLGWPVIIMILVATKETLETAMLSGAFDFLEKPFF